MVRGGHDGHAGVPGRSGRHQDGVRRQPTVYHAGEANSMLSGLLGDSSMLVIDEEKLRQTNERLARLRAKFCGGAEAT